MDCVIAKIKERDVYCKILSDRKIFEDIKLDEGDVRSYDDEYKLEEDEWFVVDDFSSKEYCLSLLKTSFEPTSFSYMNKGDYGKIDFVISIHCGHGIDEYYMFQKITPSLFLGRKKMLSWDNLTSEQANLLDGTNVLVLKDKPDCVYVKSVDKLYFKKLCTITSIFDGINVLYKEATDTEVESFFSLDIVNLAPAFDKEQIKRANRRRIKEALDKYGEFSEAQKANLPSYIREYCPDLYDTERHRCLVSNEKDLTRLLYALNQRYYTTNIDGEKRLAYSVGKVY